MTKTNAMFQTTRIRFPRFGFALVLTYLAAVCFGFRISCFPILSCGYAGAASAMAGVL
jgi:hypothetical protein